MRLDERLAAKSSLGNGSVANGDPFAEMKNRIHQALIADLGPQLFAEGAEARELRVLVEPEVRRVIEAERTIAASDREQLIEEIIDDTVGHGPLERLLADETVTEIMVNGPHDVWIERNGRLFETPVKFLDASHVRRIINKIVAQVGRRIDESSPMVDARLPDGSRVNAVIPPLSLSGPLVTIRKFARERFTLADLVRLGTLNAEIVDFLERCVRAELNVLISGGTGTGKTTLLNAVSAAIPDSERIVTIEDAAELQLNQRHVLRLESRPPNVEGSGEVSVRDLVRNSLRMRPDRIVVGEVRGAEALDMLQAMNTGHDGSLCTLHANSPRDALSRLETMVLMAGFELPVKAIRQQVSSALELIVHLERLEDGGRRVTSIAEVQRMESDIITLEDIFKYRVEAVRPDHTVVGRLEPTGIQPTFMEKFQKRGVELPMSLFTRKRTPGDARAERLSAGGGRGAWRAGSK